MINIPESLYYSDKLYYLYTDNCYLKCSTEINGYKFMKIIEKNRVISNDEDISIFDKIAAILRFKGEMEGDMNKHLLD